MRPIKSIRTFTDMSLVAKPSVSASSWTLRFIKYNNNLSWIFHTSAVAQLSPVPIYTFDIMKKIFLTDRQMLAEVEIHLTSKEIVSLCVHLQIRVWSCVQTHARCGRWRITHIYRSAVLQVNEQRGCSAHPSPIFSTWKEAGSCCGTCITAQTSPSMRGWSQVLQPEVGCTATCIALIATSVAPKVAKWWNLSSNERVSFKARWKKARKEDESIPAHWSCIIIQLLFTSQLLIKHWLKRLATLAGLHKEEKYIWVSSPSSKHWSPSNKRQNEPSGTPQKHNCQAEKQFLKNAFPDIPQTRRKAGGAAYSH